MGFSQKMCLPAWRLRNQISMSVGRGADQTASSAYRRESRARSGHLGMLQRAASDSAASRYTSVMATIFSSGKRKASVSAWTRPMRPAPMIPMFSFCVLNVSPCIFLKTKARFLFPGEKQTTAYSFTGPWPRQSPR